MQFKALHKNCYKLYGWARTQETLDRWRLLHETRVNQWKRHKDEGLSDAACARLSGISRASYYRSRRDLQSLARGITPPSKVRKKQNAPQWGEAEKQLVLMIRRANRTFGRDKIAVILKRDHSLSLSPSTVGRILAFLKEKHLITRSRSASRNKRARNFKGRHARPWTFKPYQDMRIGERVQIDHMSVSKNGMRFKHFQAWDRKSKYLHAQVYTNATATSARRFLEELLEITPFHISSIQVDGGSEFMAQFEQACAEYGLPLIVLPPKKPQYNGGVERANRTMREEFYDDPALLADTIEAMRPALASALAKYNGYRPHRALNNLTPLEYLRINSHEGLTLSQTA